MKKNELKKTILYPIIIASFIIVFLAPLIIIAVILHSTSTILLVGKYYIDWRCLVCCLIPFIIFELLISFFIVGFLLVKQKFYAYFALAMASVHAIALPLGIIFARQMLELFSHKLFEYTLIETGFDIDLYYTHNLNIKGEFDAFISEGASSGTYIRNIKGFKSSLSHFTLENTGEGVTLKFYNYEIKDYDTLYLKYNNNHFEILENI